MSFRRTSYGIAAFAGLAGIAAVAGNANAQSVGGSNYGNSGGSNYGNSTEKTGGIDANSKVGGHKLQEQLRRAFHPNQPHATMTILRMDPISYFGDPRLDGNGNCVIPQTSTFWTNSIKEFLYVIRTPVTVSGGGHRYAYASPAEFGPGTILSLDKEGKYVDYNKIVNLDSVKNEIGNGNTRVTFTTEPADPSYYEIVSKGLARKCMDLTQ